MRVNGGLQLLVIVACISKNLSGSLSGHEFYIFLNETLNRKVCSDFRSPEAAGFSPWPEDYYIDVALKISKSILRPSLRKVYHGVAARNSSSADNRRC